MDITKAFVTLIALINPLGAIPSFLALTAHQSTSEKRRTLMTAAFSTAMVIVVSALLGQRLLSSLGISIASLQVGGGVLLFLMAVGMFNAQMGPSRTTPEEQDEAIERSSIAVVPLTIPLLTGPGTVSTVIIYAEKAQHWWEMAAILGIGVFIGLLVWMTFKLAEPISDLTGKTGLNIMTRLMGLILAALAVEFVADGIRALAAA